MVRQQRFRPSLQLHNLDRRDLPSATLPFNDGFESGALGANWGQSATNNGAISVTSAFSPISGSKHVLVGPSASGINSRSEMILHVDLGGAKNAVLSFKEKEFNDLDHPMPASFTGTSNSDGVALSVDGTNWYSIVSLTGTASQNVTQVYTYNLGKFAADHGLSLTGDTMIKFQNYGNQAAPNGGFAFDDVNITMSGTINGKVYQDANQDGVYQVGETLSGGHKIYVDGNNDGKLNIGTETAVFTEHLPAPILDNKRSLYPMFVYGGGNPVVGDVDVNIALAHTYAGDLDISLIAPNGTRVLLSSDNGGSGDNYYITKFDDDASTSIVNGSAPFSGTFRPEGKLSDFNGSAMHGWWYLEIIDDAANDTGTLGGWSLDLGRVYKTVVNQPISETEVMYVPMPISDPYFDDMDVVVNIDHPNVGDLSILLATPDNNYVYLSNNNGGTGNNFTNTRFDDEAATSITTGTAPYNGHYRPQDKLSTLENLGAYSQYELRVADDKAGNTGTLKDWSLILTNTFTAGVDIDPILAGNPGYSDRYADFKVPDIGGPIVDMDVLVYAEHSDDEVLNLELTNIANNKSVDLTTGNALQGASGKNFFNTLFDDEATQQVIGGTGPYTGAIRPYESLTKFDGLTADGDWKLKVDNTKLSSGQLNWAALVFRTADVAASLGVQSIVDQGTITSNLTVSGSVGSIADLDVRVNLLHTYDGDLDVFLTAPNGKKIELFTDVGAGGDNFSGTILDDEAAVSIVDGLAPFSGSYRPEGSLAEFDDIDANGTWTLTVTDDAANDTGLLAGWSLIITTGERYDVTDAKGAYEFDNLAPGNVVIRVDDNTGIDWTNPDSGKYSETVTYGGDLLGRDFGYVDDNMAPTASFTPLNWIYSNTPISTLEIVFSEPVTGVDIGDFVLTKGGAPLSLFGATVSTNDNITWTVGNLAFLNSNNGNYKLTLISVGSGIMDSALNPMASFTNPSQSWILDKTAPQILALNRTGPATTTATTVSWEYQFSENVVNLNPSHFALSGSGAAGAKIVSVVGGYVYAQTFNNGELTLSMVNSVDAGDLAGNLVSNLPFTGETYTIARPVVHQPVIQVNDGSAQRSRVSSLTVTFESEPFFPNGAPAAFQLKRQSDGAVVPLNVAWNGSVVTLTFGGPLFQYGTLIDGRYDLTINGDKIGNFDPNNDGTFNEDYVFHFHRFFGDSNGDGSVTAIDFNAFRLAYGQTGVSAFDYYQINVVTALDFNEFRLRYGRTI